MFKIKVTHQIDIENILKKNLYLFSKRELYLGSKIQTCLFYSRGVTECTQPVEVVSYKIGVCKVSPSGKECRTEFERLNYNGRTSVVLCRPFTGRMHQIRVHLQYLGRLYIFYHQFLYSPDGHKKTASTQRQITLRTFLPD